MSDNSNIKDAADAVKGIVEAVPIYEDLMQPAVKEIGKGLYTLSKTIHIALAPISALVWGYEQIEKYLLSSLEDKLKNTPKENIITPDPSIAGPTIEALRFTGHKEEIREMFSTLLATAMDSTTEQNAHPSFVEVIRQLTPDEAKIITYLGNNNYQPMINLLRTVPEQQGETTICRNFSLVGAYANCMFMDLVPSYLDNLQRLGIINIPEGRFLTTPNAYNALENHPDILVLSEKIKALNTAPIFQRRYFFLTDFGKQFYTACI